MSKISKGEHCPESGHQTVEELIVKNEAEVAERRTAIEGLQGQIEGLQGQIEGLQGQIEGLQGQIEGLQGQIAEVTNQVRAEQSEVYKLEGEIAEPKKYKEGLVEFVNRLRQQDVENWGYDNIVNGLFNPNQPPVLNHNLERSLTPEMKQEIIQSVLAETGLTEQEGQDLLRKQAEKNRARHEQDKGGRSHG